MHASYDWSRERERLLGRLSRSRHYLASTVPLKMRRRIAYSLRTAWAVFLTLVLMELWEWSSIALYLSPVITIIASAPYFGLWQENCFKALYAILIGTALGVIVGLSYKIKFLQLILIFASIFWLNRIPSWERLTTILASLGFLLGAVWPTLTSGDIIGIKSFIVVILLNGIPYIVTGVSLLFPRPALATYQARFQALLVCRKLSHMITAVVKAFLSYDDLDLCITEFDQYYLEIVTDIATLKALSKNVDHERLLFPAVQDMPVALNILFDIVEVMLQELIGLKEMVKRINYNKTQETFAKELRPALIEIIEESEIALTMIGEHFDSYDPWTSYVPDVLRQFWRNCFSSDFWHPQRRRVEKFMLIPSSRELISESKSRKSGKVPSFSARSAKSITHDNVREELGDMQHYSFTKVDIEHGHGNTLADTRTEAEPDTSNLDSRASEGNSELPNDFLIVETFREAIDRLSSARTELLNAYSDVRRDYIVFRPNLAVEPIIDHAAGDDSVAAIVSLLKEEQIINEEKQRIAGEYPLDTMDSAKLQSLVEDEIREQHIVRLSMREETMRLSLHNFGARGAFMHRLSVLVEYVASLEHILVAKQKPFLWAAFFLSYLHPVVAYIISLPMTVFSTWDYCVDQYYESPNISTCVKRVATTFFSTYRQALKIATAVTIAISILIYDLMPFLYQGGLWMTLVVIIIRQDLASSSFLTAVQRLEGTVVGAMYAFLVYVVFDCDHDHCGYLFEIPVIVVWIAICGIFRDGPQHGYSAVVASLTPIILLLGSNDASSGAWGRIEETFLGIVIYLAVDNLIMPNRTYPQVKTSVLTCIDYTRLVFHESMRGLDRLIQLEKQYSEQEDKCQWREEGEEGEVAAAARRGMGVYGAAADVRLRSGTLLSMTSPDGVVVGGVVGGGAASPVENSGSRKSMRSNSASDLGALSEVEVELPPIMVTDPAAPQAIQDLLGHCSKHFAEAERRLTAMRGELAKQGMLVGLVQYEPELWRRPFPQAAYQRLLDAFRRVYLTGLALNSGARAFTVLLCQMMRRREDISSHLSHFKFMIRHIFLVSVKAEDAMSKAHDAFKKMYARTGEEVDLSSLLALRRVWDKLAAAVEEHFRVVYMRQPPAVLLTLNPYFLVAWQNVFESTQDLVKNLSELGTTLLTVRNMEHHLEL